MENAHLRLGQLEYQRFTEKISTRIRLRVDHYVGEDRQAHLLSVFGNDSDVGAITAAIHEKATFTLFFPGGATREISIGDHAACYRGSVSLPDRKHPVRHLVAVSEELRSNGSLGRTLLLRYRRQEAWATLVSFMGLPGIPDWSESMMSVLEQNDRILDLEGIGCTPVALAATVDEMLAWIEDGLRSKELSLPDKNGPVEWPRFSSADMVRPTPEEPSASRDSGA
jgi:hypothetical protein